VSRFNDIDYKIHYYKSNKNSNMSNAQKAGWLGTIILLLTLFQGVIPMLPQAPETVITIISAVVMYLVNGLTALNQYLSTKIANMALNASLVVFLLAVIGGLNDLFAVIPLSETVSQWIRFGITFASMVLNFLSKQIYPAPQPYKPWEKPDRS